MIQQRELFVDNNYDLSTHKNCSVIGSLPLGAFENRTPATTLIRPRTPLAEENNRQLSSHLPRTLRALFNAACDDMRAQGLNPDEYKLYPLFQSGWVEPDKCLRAGFWHFDLMRNMRLPVPDGKMAFSIGYSVMNSLPTMFVNHLRHPNDMPLPARATIENEQSHVRLGKNAQDFNNIVSPSAGEIVRYDSMTLHRGRPNTGNKAVYRVFANLSFSR